MAQTAPSSPLRQDEALALGLAVVGHVALALGLIYLKPDTPPPPPPERMTVTIADEVGLVSTSPDPMAEAAPDSGATLGDSPPPPVREAVEPPKPEPKPLVAPPKPAPALRPQPAQKPQAKPKQPNPAPPANQNRNTRPTPNPGARNLGQDFDSTLGGKGKSQNPAPVTGPQKMAINSAIWREIKPFWQGKVPQGLNTEKIITYVKIQLNPDGSLAGRPVVLRQDGVDASNRQQASRHAEEAVKAIVRAAPFELPPTMYSYWKSPPEIKFSKGNS